MQKIVLCGASVKILHKQQVCIHNSYESNLSFVSAIKTIKMGSYLELWIHLTSFYLPLREHQQQQQITMGNYTIPRSQ